jgi:ribose transport system ATP-binding protein
VHKGEIHGLAGLIGSGRSEILETIFGLRGVTRGALHLAGVALENCSPRKAIDSGIALVPEDRHVQGLVLDHTIERNLTLPRLPHFSRLGWLDHHGSLAHARSVMTTLAVKAPSTSTVVKNLSGGNQQKVVFAKWNQPRPRVLLLDEPTIGVDVGAREEIYGLVREAARCGTAVLIVSSDLAELLRLCDRISIVAGGAIIETVARDALDGTEALHHLIQLPRTAGAQIA